MTDDPNINDDTAARECNAAYEIIENSPDPVTAAITLATCAVDFIAATGGRKVARDFVNLQLARIRANAIPQQVEVDGITADCIRAAIKIQAKANDHTQATGLRVFTESQPRERGDGK